MDFNCFPSVFSKLDVIIFYRTLNKKSVKCSDYDVLLELATVCCLCNDSSLDFNEVRVLYQFVSFLTCQMWVLVLISFRMKLAEPFFKWKLTKTLHRMSSAILSGCRIDLLISVYFFSITIGVILSEKLTILSQYPYVKFLIF